MRTDRATSAATHRNAQPCVLVTGFEPFDGADHNPSWEVARALHGRTIGGAQVVAEQLPVEFNRSLQALGDALARHRPDAVLSLGLAGSRSAVSVERVAVNLIDARIPDNAGEQPSEQPVHAGGPAAYFMRWPAKAIVERLTDAGLPTELSYSAGTFVCNQVAYALMQALAHRPGVPAGFIHLPPLPPPAACLGSGQPLALDDQLRAVTLAIEVLRERGVTDDASLRGGTLD